MDENKDGFAQVGETINYAFAVTNTGNVTITNIVVTDTKVTVVGNPIASLAVGATNTATITASYILTQAEIDAGQVTNSALAIGKDPKRNDVKESLEQPRIMTLQLLRTYPKSKFNSHQNVKYSIL